MSSFADVQLPIRKPKLIRIHIVATIKSVGRKSQQEDEDSKAEMFNISNITNTTLKSRMAYAYAGPVEVVFLIFLMVCIISGNCLVCLAFSSGDRKFRTVTNYFVINLALSDILVGIFSMSFWLCIRTGGYPATIIDSAKDCRSHRTQCMMGYVS